MAPPPPHDHRAQAQCHCGTRYIPTQSNTGEWCDGCCAILFTFDGQVPAGDQSPPSLPTAPAHRVQRQQPQTQTQQPPSRMTPANADWAKLHAEMDKLRREQHAEHERLRLRQDELQRRAQMMMMAMMQQQQQQQMSAQMLRCPLPPDMRIASSASHITNQPAIRSGIDVGPRPVAANYNLMPRRTTPVNHAKRTHERPRPGYFVSPMTRTDSFSPLRQHATPPIGPHCAPPIQQQQQLFSSPAASRRPSHVVVPANTMLRPTGASDGIVLAQTHISQHETLARWPAHARHDSFESSAGQSGSGYASSNSSINHTPNSTPPSVSDAWSNASPAHKPRPAPVVGQVHRNAQLAALNAQLAHEQAIKSQREQQPGTPITNPPPKIGTGRLLCPDCKLDKPIVRKKNDGIHCTSCFSKKIKAGACLQTLEQRASVPPSPRVHKAAPTARMSPNHSAAMHHKQGPSPVPSGYSSISTIPPYELDFARRRAADARPGSSPQLSGYPAQRGRVVATQQPAKLIRRVSQTTSYMPSPLANGQYRVPRTTASPDSLLFQSPPKAGAGTPKRGHEEAFATVGLGVSGKDAPTSQLSPPQSNKKSKPSPREHPAVLTSEPRQSTILTPDPTPSKVGQASQGVETAARTDETDPFQLDGASDWMPAWVLNDIESLSPLWVDKELASRLPEPADSSASLPTQNAPVDHLQMSTGSRRSLAEIEAELAVRLPIENVRLDAEKIAMAGSWAA